MKKEVPQLKSDKQAEAFLEQDLSNLDFSQFKLARFEFEKKDGQINMRVPKPLLEALKAHAKNRAVSPIRSSFAKRSNARSQDLNPKTRPESFLLDSENNH